MIIALVALLPLLFTASAAPTTLTKRFARARIVSGRDGKCLAAAPKTGTNSPVSTVDCNNSVWGKLWDINPGSGSVILSGTNLVLDAGSTPGNNGALKVWDSYPGLYQQTWYLTGDNRIAITGGNQCLDEGDNGIQTYQCTPGNTNQVFYIQPGDEPPPPSSSSASPTSSPISTPSTTPPTDGGIPVGPIYPDTPGEGRRLHPNGRNDLCVTVQNGYAGQGAAVAISSCFGNNDDFRKLQLWDLPTGGAARGNVKLHGTDWCLDAGTTPSNGGGVKIWDCYSGLVQQDWVFNDGTLNLANNQCLDVKQGSQPGTQKPYNSLRDLQTFQCYVNNSHQQFNLYLK